MDHQLLRDFDSQGEGEVIDLAAFAEKGIKPPKAKRYQVLVGTHLLVLDEAVVTGRDILLKAGVEHPECQTLYQKLRGCDFEKISLDENVDLTQAGIEKFVIKAPEVFTYRLDDEPEMTDRDQLTPTEILRNGGLKPEDYYLVQIGPTGQQTSYESRPDELIPMECPPVKYVSVFRGTMPVS